MIKRRELLIGTACAALSAAFTHGSRTGFDVWGGLGQSNEVGEGTPISGTIDIGGPNNFQYTTLGAIIAASDPLSGPETGSVGHLNAFARDYYIPNRGNKTLLVQCSVGGTSFAGGNWNPGNAVYEAAVTRMNAAMASAPGNLLKGVLWLLGENDMAAGTTAAAYISDFQAMIADFRSRVTGAANVPIVLGGLLPAYVNMQTAPQQLMQTNGIAVMPSHVSKCGYADSFNPTPLPGLGDNTHYSAIGQRGYADGVTPGDSMAKRMWGAFNSGLSA